MTQIFHYEATFADGKKGFRKSPRTYTHAVRIGESDTVAGIASWAGSEALAHKASAQERKSVGLNRGEIAVARVVKVTGKSKCGA